MKMMKDRLGAFPLAIQLPLGAGVGFRGVLDVIRQEAIEWPDVDGARPRVRSLSDAEKAQVSDARVQLQEGLCEVDSVFLEAYVNGETSKIEDVTFINAALRRATISMKAVPCLVGAAFRNKGVQCVMDSVILYLPSPLDSKRVLEATVPGSDAKVALSGNDNGDMVCLAWKVVHDHRMGLITYCRVVSGTLKAGVMLKNTSLPVGAPKERLNKLVVLHAEDMEQVASVSAGNIGAIIGLKNVATGDTLMES